MNGFLDWGVKVSLLLYVLRAPGGALEVEGLEHHGSIFRFPLDSTAEISTTRFPFGGAVRFYGHSGAYMLEIGQIAVCRRDDAWRLAFSDSQQDLRIAAFDLLGEPRREDDASLAWDAVRLTKAGAALFGGAYGPGTLFDPLSITVNNTAVRSSR